jgi:hypothetical protein
MQGGVFVAALGTFSLTFWHKFASGPYFLGQNGGENSPARDLFSIV